MGELVKFLPAFATDYSSAASLLSDFGGLVIIYSPGGCMGNFTGFDELRWFKNPKHVLLMEMHEMDLIFGELDSGLSSILDEVERINPCFVAILKTPVSAMVGIDTDSIARKIELKSGIPSFSLNTDGYGTYHAGIQEAMKVLMDRFAPKKESKLKNTLNILGYSPLEHSEDDMCYIREVIENSGFSINASVPGTNIDNLRKIADAEINLVISSSCMPLAKRLERDYSIPYLKCSPMGKNATLDLTSLSNDLRDKHPASCECDSDHRILIIGEQFRSNTIREILQSTHHVDSDVGAFFSFDTDSAKPGDRYLKGEKDFKNMMTDGNYSHLIADPLFEPLVPPSIIHIHDPICAISSRLFVLEKHSMRDCSWLNDIEL